MTIIQFFQTHFFILPKPLCRIIEKSSLFRFNMSSAVDNRFLVFFFLSFRRRCPCPNHWSSKIKFVFLVSITVPLTSVFDPVNSNCKPGATALVGGKTRLSHPCWKSSSTGNLKTNQELNELPMLGAQMWQKNLTTILLLLFVPSRWFINKFGEKILSAPFLRCLFLVLFRSPFRCFEMAASWVAWLTSFFETLRRRRAPPPICLRIVFWKKIL